QRVPVHPRSGVVVLLQDQITPYTACGLAPVAKPQAVHGNWNPDSMGAAQRDFLARPELEQLQLARLRQLLDEILPANAFHARRLSDVRDLRSLADLRQLPLLAKHDLLADQYDHPPYGSALTYPLDHYSRLHQTSGTSGQPLRWLDTAASWSWML